MLAGAAALAIAASAWWFLHEQGTRRTDSLLAQAYTAHRTLELRFRGAGYAPLRQTRGDGQSRLDVPGSLLEAESEIAKRQGEKEKAIDWLIARSQADILEWNYDAAIDALRGAQALAPNESKVEFELSTAFFERAQATGHVADYGTAVEMISRVIEKNPDDAVALFNRALIYEKLYLYAESDADWKRYLLLDPSGDWSHEARQHLTNVEEKLQQKRKASELEPLNHVESIVANGTGQASDDFLDARIEEYQRIVLTKWAPEFLEPNQKPIPGRQLKVRTAIERISRIMVVRHGDTFLQDLLLSSSSSTNKRFVESLGNLSRAMQADASGDEEEAQKKSKAAETGFGEVGNTAGALRARFEEAYSQQFSSEVAQCRQTAQSVVQGSHRRGYKWLEAQALIEWGYCANMAGDLVLATKKLREAARVADEAGYEESLERAMVGEAAMQWQTGSTALAWDLALGGLDRFWKHATADVRGASLYAVLDLMAEENEQWRLQEAVLKESIPLVDRGNDPLVSAQTRSRLASAELMLHRYDEAESALQKSLYLFRSAPQTFATRVQQATVSVNIAKVEMQTQQIHMSWTHLQTLRPIIEDLHENLSLLDYYATLGEVCRNTDRYREAEEADRKAIELFQSSLAGLNDPRDRMAWLHEASVAYRSLAQLKLNENDPAGALQAWEEYRDSIASASQRTVLSPAVISRGSRLEKGSFESSMSVPGLRKPEVDDHQKIIAYAKLPDGLFAWLRTRQGVLVSHIDSWDEVSRLVRVFFRECSTPSSRLSTVVEHGQQLYRRLVLPFSGQFSSNDILVFEPDEELAALPFGALVDEAGQYLGSKHSIVISVGSRNGTRQTLSHRLNSHDSILLAVANDTSGREKSTDPLAEEEVAGIASLFLNPVILSHAAPPRRAFHKLLPEAFIFHYAGHSLTSVRGGELSVLDRDQYGRIDGLSLRSQDVARDELRDCHLVVLSACATNRGEEGRWLDRENLAVAFLNQGVPEVVASQWQVDSNATTLMMKEFYSQLLEGASTPDALRQAGAKIRTNGQLSHPYYWAAFSVLSRI
jgi:CHAT domain-containing protein